MFFLYIALSLLQSKSLTPAEATSILVALNSQYSTTEPYRVTYHYMLYKLKGMEKIDSATTTMVRAGNRMHQEIGPVETVVGPDFILNIYHDLEHIALASNDKDYLSRSNLVEEYTRGLLGLCSSIVLKEGPEYYSLVLVIPDYVYEKITITYNPRTYQITQMELVLLDHHPMVEFAGKGLFTIKMNMEKNIKTQPATFQLGHYLEKNPDGSYTGKNKLAGYKVINLAVEEGTR